MDVALSVFCFFYAAVEVYSAIPPDICFTQFKWQDCGLPPKPVVYYYKSGSRCEVGMWRGCLPNPNMFVDEYECVQTCIFSHFRARPEDFHHFQVEEQLNYEEETTTNAIESTAGDFNATGTADEGTTASATDIVDEAADKEATPGPEGEGPAAAEEEAAAQEAPAEATEAAAEENAAAEGGEANPAEEGGENPPQEEAPAEN